MYQIIYSDNYKYDLRMIQMIKVCP